MPSPGCLHADHAAGVVGNEAFGRGAQHDFIGFVRGEELVHWGTKWVPQRSGVAFVSRRRRRYRRVSADELVFTIPKRTLIRVGCILHEGGTHFLQPGA